MGLADLLLGSFIYNAHTTASYALWACVPLVTRRGTAFAGRVAASLLTALDLPELVTEDLESYEALALALAKEPPRLHAIREKLKSNRQSAPLFDTASTTRHIEAAYEEMRARRLRGEAPGGLRRRIAVVSLLGGVDRGGGVRRVLLGSGKVAGGNAGLGLGDCSL